jgi:thiamine biosynthesis lipoprotein
MRNTAMPDPRIAVATSHALGSGVQVAVTDERRLDQAIAVVLDWLAKLDQAASRFRPDSEISRLNAAGGGRRKVSPLFARVVAVALEVAAITDGIVDPTVGAAMEAIGYDRDSSEIRAGGHGPEPRGRTAPAPGWRRVRLDLGARTIELAPAVHLDVGASAKAFAADETAAAASVATGTGVLVSLGGDIAVAGAVPEGGWRVRVTDDHAAPAEAPGQTVSITGGGLATSSTTVRAWTADGSARHHIVDPRTGWSAPVVWRTVSVTASSCVRANAATTAAIVLGPTADAWLRERRIPARLVRRDGAVVYVAGWPAEGDDLPAALPSVLPE